MLIFLRLAESDELKFCTVAAQEIVNFQKFLLANYWELPNPDAPCEELDTLMMSW